MNIQEAKQEIIHTLQAYLRKDDVGNYLFPAVLLGTKDRFCHYHKRHRIYRH